MSSKFHTRRFIFSLVITFIDLICVLTSTFPIFFLACALLALSGTISHWHYGSKCTPEKNCGLHKEGDFTPKLIK